MTTEIDISGQSEVTVVSGVIPAVSSDISKVEVTATSSTGQDVVVLAPVNSVTMIVEDDPQPVTVVVTQDLDVVVNVLSKETQLAIDLALATIQEKVDLIEDYRLNTLSYKNATLGYRNEIFDQINLIEATVQAQVLAWGAVAQNSVQQTLETMLLANYYTAMETDQAISGAVTALGTSFATSLSIVTATLASDYYTISAADAAIASGTLALKTQLESPTGSIGAIVATLSNDYYTAVETDSAIAAMGSTLTSSIGSLAATVSTQATTIATLQGNATASLVFRTEAGSSGALLELVSAANPAGSASTARIRADNIILDGSITSRHIEAESLDASVIGTGKLNARFIEVTELLTLDAATAGFSMGKASTSDGNDGIFMGVDETGQFGFAASRTFGVRRQSLEIEPDNGLIIKNAKFQNVGDGGVSTTTVSTSLNLSLNVDTEFLTLRLFGGGGAGTTRGASTYLTGGSGGDTIVQLRDGTTVISTYTALGGLGGAGNKASGVGTSGEAGETGLSGFGSGGGEQTATASNGISATGFGHGGGGMATSGLSPPPMNVGGAGGKAGQRFEILDINISGLVNPNLVITIGAAGQAVVYNHPTNGPMRGGNGSAGMVQVVQTIGKTFVGDIVTSEPTAKGTFNKAANATGSAVFPNLGKGIWFLQATNGLQLGQISVNNGGSNILLTFTTETTAVIIADTQITLVGTPNANARTISYAFYGLGDWG